MTIQRVYEHPDTPANKELRRWMSHALDEQEKAVTVTLRIVDREEAQALNARWRGQQHATNVLAFPLGCTLGSGSILVGDIVICAPLACEEARQQGKTLAAHWAHLVIHGALHLRGFDHIDAQQATQMERLECELLAALGFPDPYQGLNEGG